MRDTAGTLERSQVVARYRQLASEAGFDQQAIEWLAALPPYLCHKLLGKSPEPRRFSSLGHAMTGHEDHPPFTGGKILLSAVGLVGDVHAELPLEGHVPIKAPGICRWLGLALSDLRVKAPHRIAFINEWCSMVVWLTADPNDPPNTQLTSLALPMVPHCTFVTAKAIRHIPPATLLPVVGWYGLQENLFHEALHQQLSATLVFEGLLADDSAESPQVEIPWRNTSWPIDRALHAAWVYHHLIEFRTEELSRGDSEVSDTLKDSLEDATAARDHLLTALTESAESFNDRGRALVNVLAS